MPAFVGCDLGTMGTKAAVVDVDGSLLGEFFEEVPLHHPRPGWVEQHLEEIEASAHRSIRAAVAASGRAADIAGVAFSGQMSGIGSIAADFTPATHFDSWLDTRCAPYIEAMAAHGERVTAVSGCPPTYSHGPKMLWWQRERGEDYRRVAKFVVPGAYVAGRLCGLRAEDAFIDRTYLHFSNLADTAHARWSSELVDTFGVDAARLPRIVDPLDVVGRITPEGAGATGLPPGTPVAAGAGDQTAAALGAGVVSPGQAFDSAGTASVFAVCTDAFRPDVRHQTLMATAGVVPGTWFGLAFINGGGLALRWFRDEIACLEGPDAYARLDEQAAGVEPGAGDLLWFPHLQGRVLPPRPHARGAWAGLTAGHHHGHLFRAILEGIAYEYALWAEQSGAELHEARVLGGGARSRLWNQIKADVLGIDWVPMHRQECGVLGDALIAAVATGHVDDLAGTAQAWQSADDRVNPDPDRHATYRHLRTAAGQLGASLQEVYEQLRPPDQTTGDHMRVTQFTDRDGRVATDVRDTPAWQPFAEFDGRPLERVELVELGGRGPAELQLVRIAAGGHFAMHASPDLAFCQIVRGRGTLRLPDGRELPYAGPELYVFHPDTLHEWVEVTEDTLLSVCLVRQGGQGEERG